MGRIYDCPVELLQAVVATACAYDLRTACALRLVDRHISSVCAPLRFNEVTASGEAELNALLRALNGADPADVRIHHLFICDKNAEEADRVSEHIPLTPADLLNVLEVRNAYRLNREEAPRLEKVIAGILGHAASHVRSLCLLAFNPASTGLTPKSFGNYVFPRLEDLTLRLVAGAYTVGGEWRAMLPELHALTVRLPPDFASQGPRFISLLAHGDKLTDVTLVDLQTSLGNNIVIRELLSEDGVCRPERLEIHPVGVKSMFAGRGGIDEAALADLHRIMAASPVDMIIAEVQAGIASYDTWKRQWMVGQ